MSQNGRSDQGSTAKQYRNHGINFLSYSDEHVREQWLFLYEALSPEIVNFHACGTALLQHWTFKRILCKILLVQMLSQNVNSRFQDF